jgi:uncharacterized protein (UPF0248 family)
MLYSDIFTVVIRFLFAYNTHISIYSVMIREFQEEQGARRALFQSTASDEQVYSLLLLSIHSIPKY